MKPNQSIIFKLDFKLTFIIGCMLSVQRSIIGAWSNILSATRKVTCTMYKQDKKHTILCYVNKVCSMFLLTSGQYSGKSSFFKLIFFLCQTPGSRSNLRLSQNVYTVLMPLDGKQ